MPRSRFSTLDVLKNKSHPLWKILRNQDTTLSLSQGDLEITNIIEITPDLGDAFGNITIINEAGDIIGSTLAGTPPTVIGGVAIWADVTATALEGDPNFTWDKSTRKMTLIGNDDYAFIYGSVDEQNSQGLWIDGGEATLTDTNGGIIHLQGGIGNGTGNAGSISLSGGDAQGSGAGGSIMLTPGTGAGADGIVRINGNIHSEDDRLIWDNTSYILTLGTEAATAVISGATATTADTDGGIVAMLGGNGNGSGNGADVGAQGGDGGATGDGGAAGIKGGAGGATSGSGGNSSVGGGDAQTEGDGGSVLLAPGTGAGAGVDGVIKAGSIGGNYTQFDSTGHQTMAGNAQPWEDLRIEPSVRQAAGTGVPAFEKWFDDSAGTSRGVFLYSFTNENTANQKEIFFTMQMPHAWNSGPIAMHIHWVPAATENATEVIWGIEYCWKDIGEIFGDTVIAYSSGTLVPDDANITAGKHYISEFTDLTPGSTADGLSSILIGRIFRFSGDASDTYTNKVGLLYIDAHYQLNSLGSTDEYGK